MRWTIQARLLVMTGISILSLAGIIFAGITYVDHLGHEVHKLGFIELPASRHMASADMMHDGIRGTALRAIIAGGSKDPKEIEEIKTEFKDYTTRIDKELNDLAALNISPELHEKVKATRQPIAEYIKVSQEIVNLSLNGQTTEATEKVPALQASFEALENSLENVGDFVQSNIDKDTQISQDYATNAKRNLYIFAIISMVMAIGVSFYFSRQLIATIKSSVLTLTTETQRLGTSAEEVSKTSGGLKENANEQAAAVQQTAASLEEINSMVAKTSENSKRLSESNKKSLEIVNDGQKAVGEVYEAVQAIQQTNEAVASQINESNRRISEIVKVISEIGQKTQVINEIVFQTKLLSFNASVEAARAGENGKGFAVVAEEVGNLAQSSGRAAKEISDMLAGGIQTTNEILDDNKEKITSILNASKEKVEYGTEVVEKCRTTLDEIVSQMDEMSTMITEITGAISEQTVGIGEITSAVHIFDKSSQNNASMSNTAMEISADLLQQFNMLQGSMVNLSALVGQNAEHPPTDETSNPNQHTTENQDSHHSSAA